MMKINTSNYADLKTVVAAITAVTGNGNNNNNSSTAVFWCKPANGRAFIVQVILSSGHMIQCDCVDQPPTFLTDMPKAIQLNIPLGV